MTREQLSAVYLDWVNNYLTLQTYADHHGLHLDEAAALIALAKHVHNTQHPEA